MGRSGTVRDGPGRSWMVRERPGGGPGNFKRFKIAGVVRDGPGLVQNPGRSGVVPWRCRPRPGLCRPRPGLCRVVRGSAVAATGLNGAIRGHPGEKCATSTLHPGSQNGLHHGRVSSWQASTADADPVVRSALIRNRYGAVYRRFWKDIILYSSGSRSFFFGRINVILAQLW